MMIISRKKTLSAVDPTRRLALAGLARKKQERRLYPITKKDLLSISRCPFCQNSRLKHLTEVSLTSGLLFFRTSICRNCTFVFRSISPSFAWFRKCWKIIETDKLEVFNPDTEKYKQRRYKEYLAMVQKYIHRGSALEIGSGYGTGTKLFQKAGFQMEVVESEVNKARYVETSLGIPVVDTDIVHFLNTTKKQYDLIIFSNCLEHLDHPIVVMQKLRHILKPEGFVLVAVPILWDYITWTDALYLPHKVNFSQEHLLALALRSGFEALEMKYVPYFFDTSREIVFTLTPATRPSSFSIKFTPRQRRELINTVEKRYRHNLPFSSSLLKKGTLQYQVPHIDQFFQTVNLENNNLVQPHSPKDPIKIIAEYISKKNDNH